MQVRGLYIDLDVIHGVAGVEPVFLLLEQDLLRRAEQGGMILRLKLGGDGHGLGGAALLADGVLTPAVTVTTAVEGLRSIPAMSRFLGSGQARVILITLVIISTLFAVQWAGTSKIGKAFGPVMLVWFSFLGIMGLLHVFDRPGVLLAHFGFAL